MAALLLTAGGAVAGAQVVPLPSLPTGLPSIPVKPPVSPPVSVPAASVPPVSVPAVLPPPLGGSASGSGRGPSGLPSGSSGATPCGATCGGSPVGMPAAGASPMATGAATGPPVPAPTQGALPPGAVYYINNAGLLAELYSVLERPVALQPPALRHFDPWSTASSSDASGLPGFGRLGWAAIPTLVFTVLLAVGLAMAGLARLPGPGAQMRRRLLAGWRRRRISAQARRRALRSLLIGAGVCALGGGASAAAAMTGVAFHTSPTAAAADTTPTIPPRHDLVAWTVLATIEGDISSRQQAVLRQEQRIANLAASQLSSPQVEPNGLALVQVRELTTLLTTHQQSAAQYQASLKHEYQFFVTVAQDPTLRTAVTSASAIVPAAATAVQYDLDIVSTQLQQEQAIAAAQAGAPAQPLPHLPMVPGLGGLSGVSGLSGSAPHFSAPLSGPVSQGFGPTSFSLEPSLLYNGVFYAHFHTGLDIAAPRDTPLGAAAAGRVILAGSSLDRSGRLVGYGNYVVIQHDGGFMTLYGHLDKILVTAGQTVKGGQAIGLEGSTGWSTGPHLHFEIRHNGAFLDPAALI